MEDSLLLRLYLLLLLLSDCREQEMMPGTLWMQVTSGITWDQSVPVISHGVDIGEIYTSIILKLQFQSFVLEDESRRS